MRVENSYSSERGEGGIAGKKDDCHNDTALARARRHDQQASGCLIVESRDSNGGQSVLAGVRCVLAVAHDLLD